MLITKQQVLDAINAGDPNAIELRRQYDAQQAIIKANEDGDTDLALQLRGEYDATYFAQEEEKMATNPFTVSGVESMIEERIEEGGTRTQFEGVPYFEREVPIRGEREVTKELYADIEAREDVQKDAFGRLIYTNPDTGRQSIVPNPNRDLSDAITEGLFRTGPLNILETGSALVGAFTNIDTSGFSDYVASIPRVEAGDDTTESIGQVGGELMTGFGAGKAVIKGIDNLAKKISSRFKGKDAEVVEAAKQSLISKAAEASVYVAAETAATKAGTPGFVIGEDSFTDFTILDRDEDDTPQELLLKQKVDLFAEISGINLLATASIPVVIGTFGFLGGLLGSLKRGLTGGQKAAEDELMTGILNALIDPLNQGKTMADQLNPQERKQAAILIKDILEDPNNSEKIIQLGDRFTEDLRIRLDTMSTLDLSEGLSDGQKMKAISQRESQTATNPDLAVQVTAPSAALQQTLDTATEAAGGVDEAARAADTLAGEAAERASRFEPQVVSKEAEAEKIEAEIVQLLSSNDTQLQEVLSTIAMNTDEVTSIQGIIDAPIEKQREFLRSAYTRMTAKKNDLFNFTGAELSLNDTFELFEAMQAYKNTIPKDILADPNYAKAGPLERLVKLFEPEELEEAIPASEGVAAQPAVVETQEEAIERVNALLEEEGIDLSYLYTEIRPLLSFQKNRVFNNPAEANPNAATAPIRGVIDFIDSKIDELVSLDSPVGIQAKEAMDYYEEVYAPTWNSAPLRDVKQVYDETMIVSTKKKDPYEPREYTEEELLEELDVAEKEAAAGEVTVKPKDEPRFADTVDALLSNLTQGASDKAQFKQLIEVLSREGGNPEDSLSFIYSEIVQAVSRVIDNEGGLTSELVAPLREAIKPYGTKIRATNPKEAEKIDKLLATLSTAKRNKNLAMKEIDEAKKLAQEAVEKELDGVLKDFIQKGKYGAKPKDSPIKVLNSILDDPDTTRLEKLIAEVTKDGADPRLLKGIQAAHLKRMREKFFRPGTATASGTDAASGSQLAQAQRGIKPYFNNLDTIFPDDPELVTGLVEVGRIAGLLERSQTKFVPAGRSSTAFTQETITNMGTLIRFTYGPLSSTGTKIGAFTASLMRKFTPDQYTDKILRAIYTNPKEFSRIADRVLKSGMIEDAGIVDPVVLGELLRFYAPSLYGYKTPDPDEMMVEKIQREQENKRDTNQQTEELLQE